MRAAQRRLDREDGAAAMLVAISLVAMLGMLVLVVDLGGMLTLRRRMVTAADSAALAAAQSCAVENVGEAASKAVEFASANHPGLTQIDYSSPQCGTSSSGSAEVAYEAPVELFFAPILGLPDEGMVRAGAEAMWGPAGGTSPVPIVISLENGVIPCVRQAIGTACNYWYDNSIDFDVSASSNWGFLNLDAWDVDRGANCPTTGSSALADWLAGNSPPIRIRTSPAMVCIDSGHRSSTWYDALRAQQGKIKHFPVNDPAAMVTEPSGKAKYAIIGFAALKIDRVLRGDDPEAVGTPGLSGRCTTRRNLRPGDTIELAFLSDGGCPAGTDPDSVSALRVSFRRGSNEVVYQVGVHYTFDPATNVLTWKAGQVDDARIDFEWSTQGTPGLCGFHKADPNGVCLLTSWQGAQLGGSHPGGGRDFGVRAIRLSD